MLNNHIIRFLHQLPDHLVRNISIKVNANPMSFIHMPPWPYSHITSLQFARFHRVALNTTKIEHFDIHKTKPFIAHIETQNITAISVGNIHERHLLFHTLQRKTIFPKLFYIPCDLQMRLRFRRQSWRSLRCLNMQILFPCSEEFHRDRQCSAHL